MKEDGSPVNSDDASKELYEAKVKESADQRARFLTGETQMFIGGEIVPTFDELIETEEDNEGMTLTAYAFHQEQQEIEIELTKCENHAYNQASTNLDRFDMICDNQSTSDVIVERCFVRNIRKCKWTLVLKTQSGVYRIDQIADMLWGRNRVVLPKRRRQYSFAEQNDKEERMGY